MKVLIVIGTTGGHIYPGIVLADRFIKEGNEVAVVTGNGGITDKILEDKKYRVFRIAGEGLKRKVSLRLIVFIIKLIMGFSKSLAVMIKFKPDIVIGMGGYLTPPVIYSAKLLSILTVVHEQNVIPGLAVKLLSKTADRVAVSFEETKKLLKAGNTVFTGNPMREEVLKCSREEGKKNLGIEGDIRNVLVFGGSQGAESINNAMLEALKLLEPARERLRFIHLAGKRQYTTIKDEYEKAGYDARVFDYLHNMEFAYACADLVISRAGATTVAELIARSLPCILVPYPHATANHQMANANVIADTGGGIIIKNDRLNGKILADSILKLTRNGNPLANMSECMKKLYKGNAADSFIELIKSM